MNARTSASKNAAAPLLLVLSSDALLSAPLPSAAAPSAPVAAPRTYRLRPGPLDAALAPVLESIPRRTPVWFLLPDAWCQTLPVPAAQLDALPPDRRAAALAPDAEAFSGLPAASTSTALAVGPAASAVVNCRILQVPNATVDALRDAAAAARLTLAGISHPALLAPMAAPDGSPAPDPLPFVPDDLPALAQALADLLALGTPPPAIHPAPPTTPLGRALPATFALSCLLLLLALGAWGWLSARAAAEEARAADLERLDTDLRRLRAEERAARDAARDAQAAYDAALAPRLGLAALRAAPATILDALAAAHETDDDGLMLRSISSPAPFAYDLQTLALSPAHIDALYAALAPRLPATLPVTPAAATALGLAPDGGPWLASYSIAPAAATAPATTPAAP